VSAPVAVSHQDTRAALLEIYQILRGAALRARQARAADPPVSREPVPAATGTGSEER
jgi:hypothetical protein